MAPPTHINHAAFGPSCNFANMTLLHNTGRMCYEILQKVLHKNFRFRNRCMFVILDSQADLCNKFFYKVIYWCSIFWLGDLGTKHHRFHWIRWMSPDLQLCSSYIKFHILRKRKPSTFFGFLYAKDKTVPSLLFALSVVYSYIWSLYRL